VSVHAVFAIVDPAEVPLAPAWPDLARRLGARACLVLRPRQVAAARMWLRWIAEAEYVAAGTGARVVVSERADVARAAQVGVQLPEHGLDVSAARRWLGPALPVGASRHDVAGALHAAREGADWITVAPVFPTPSKPGHRGLGLAGLAEIVRALRAEGHHTPVIALGGIGAAELGPVLATGVDGVAGIRGAASGALG
jgi:thiamine-phosphate pyrophosphorylase